MKTKMIDATLGWPMTMSSYLRVFALFRTVTATVTSCKRRLSIIHKDLHQLAVYVSYSQERGTDSGVYTTENVKDRGDEQTISCLLQNFFSF